MIGHCLRSSSENYGSNDNYDDDSAGENEQSDGIREEIREGKAISIGGAWDGVNAKTECRIMNNYSALRVNEHDFCAICPGGHRWSDGG